MIALSCYFKQSLGSFQDHLPINFLKVFKNEKNSGKPKIEKYWNYNSEILVSVISSGYDGDIK